MSIAARKTDVLWLLPTRGWPPFQRQRPSCGAGPVGKMIANVAAPTRRAVG